MKIWTLAENTAKNDCFAAEHGLSLYIEAADRRILFDSGQTAIFADNARLLGLDLSRVDLAVLSHGHYDHGGGLPAFLQCNDRAKIYVNEYAFGAFYNAAGRYIGLPESLKHSDRLVKADRACCLGPGITLLPGGEYEPQIPIDHAGLQENVGDRLVPDRFLHEQYLLLEEGGKRVLLSGCSHRGIRNIVRWIPCDVLIGGFHFSGLEPDGEALRRAAMDLRNGSTVYYTCHCTGLEQFAAMKPLLGDRLHYLSAGSVLEL